MEATNGRRDQLVERRRRLGYTQESLAHEVGVSPFTVAQWERGNVTPRPRYRPALASALRMGVGDVDRLLDPDQAIVLERHAVGPRLSHYESLVQGAARVLEVEYVALPGLLQTPDYAAVIERAGVGDLTEARITELVDQRIARQEVLFKESKALELQAILPERLLRDELGGPEVMLAQIEHLLEVGARPNVDIRVVPPDGSDACAISGFELLAKEGSSDPFMACTFDIGGVRYHEDPDLLRRFVLRFEHLLTVALSPTETTNRLQEIREYFHERTHHP